LVSLFTFEEEKINHGRMMLPAIVIQEYCELVGICVALYAAAK
jgi:hypothetical protein